MRCQSRYRLLVPGSLGAARAKQAGADAARLCAATVKPLVKKLQRTQKQALARLAQTNHKILEHVEEATTEHVYSLMRAAQKNALAKKKLAKKQQKLKAEKAKIKQEKKDAKRIAKQVKKAKAEKKKAAKVAKKAAKAAAPKK
jgi:histone H1/5